MSDPSALLLLVQQLQQELQNQRVEIQSLHTQTQSLRSDLDASRSSFLQLQNQLSSRSSPRSRLPDPPRFDGKPFTLRTWLPSIKAKLRSDQLVGADAFDYVWDRLEQPQQASVLHLRQSAEDSQDWDPEDIFSFFQRLCHNPREQQEAIQRFSSVRQRDEESLIAYLARFERLTYEAGASSWPDVSRVTALHRGLRPSLRQSIEESTDSLFELSYAEYVELVQSIDRRSRRPQKPGQKPGQKPVRDPFPEPMEVSNHELNTTRFDLPLSNPSSASSRRSASRSSSAERRSHRLERDLCLCCGSAQHWIADCPLSRSRSASPPASQSATQLARQLGLPRTKTTAKSETLTARIAAAKNSRPGAFS